MNDLKEFYQERQKEIKNRLNDFRRNFEKDDKEIFSEMCFCILTPQANARKCDAIIKKLKSTGLLFKGPKESISPHLKGARFINNKAGYIVDARKIFKTNDAFCVKKYIDDKDVFKTREWLVENVKGFGYKEASHFLRNIGLGRHLAILDVHILKNLKKYGAINEIPKTLSKKEYLTVEKKMKEFADKAGIPFDELDLLFWCKETGFVFK
jgi:N-glycosylase/DNA lyase